MPFSSRVFSPGGKLRWLCVPGLASAAFAADATLSFNRDVRPLLSDRCFHCHGPDGANRKAELRLDATMLHLLGLDHTRLTYPFQGRRFRLTDVHGHIVEDLLV